MFKNCFLQSSRSLKTNNYLTLPLRIPTTIYYKNKKLFLHLNRIHIKESLRSSILSFLYSQPNDISQTTFNKALPTNSSKNTFLSNTKRIKTLFYSDLKSTHLTTNALKSQNDRGKTGSNVYYSLVRMFSSKVSSKKNFFAMAQETTTTANGAEAPATTSDVNFVKDELTGEMVSKSYVLF